MTSEAQNDGGSCRRSAETATHLGGSSSSANFFRESSDRNYQLDGRSESFDNGNLRWNPHSSVGANRHLYTQRCAGADVSPPPRLPLAFSLGGTDLGIQRQRGYAAHFYEDANGYADEGDADGADDEDEEGVWEEVDEDAGKDDVVEGDDRLDGAMGKRGSAGQRVAPLGAVLHGARALCSEFDESDAPQTARVQSAGGLGVQAGMEAPPHGGGQGSIGVALCAAARTAPAAKAAPEATGRFRRATPVARAAYSVGYDRAAGESSEEPPRAGSPRDEEAAASAVGLFERASLALTATNAFSSTTQDGPEMTVEARLLGDTAYDTTRSPSAGARHTPAASVAHCEASSHAAAHRRCGRSSAGTLEEHATDSSQRYEKTERSTKDSNQSTPGHRRASTTSSPLSPQRPTVEARDEVHAHRDSGDKPSGSDTEGSTLPSSVEPTREPAAVHVMPLKTVCGAVATPEEANKLCSTGCSRSVEDLLEAWKDSTTAADIAEAACERERRVRLTPNKEASPVWGISPPTVTPPPTRQSPLAGPRSGEADKVGEAVRDCGGAEKGRRQQRLAKCSAPSAHTPPVALSISITNVFNHSVAERAWLSSDLSSTLPAPAMQVPTARTDGTAPPATASLLGEALPPLSSSNVKVSLYCRPLLVQLPSPSLRTSVLCATGNSSFVRVTLALLFDTPPVLVRVLLRALARFTVALFFLTVGLAVTDAAWSRWIMGDAYAAKPRDGMATMLLSALEWISFLGVVDW
ncbi:hypothetical protein LSCM1_01441 [Leishmania martiniquensis]|uniref:Transmembrane protein n=1 Tax=Leishmania martiniquensis TaxID=1580590 RepID=A0A836FXX5_9TRYP|nr:hypothetical protein LSCM1_01441 [Leishmania martiniquensis]